MQLILCRILAKPELKKHVYKIQIRATKSDEDGDTPIDLSMIRADDCAEFANPFILVAVTVRRR